MTYVAVGQTTYSDFPALGFGALARAAQQCVGGRVSESGTGDTGEFCCLTKTWSNATYKAVLGSSSWQYYNESRVRRALVLLLDPTASHPNGLEQVAYDFSIDRTIFVQPGFYDRLKSAAINYWKQFPPGRWKLDRTGKRAAPPRSGQPACSGGWYSMWRADTGSTVAKKVINSVPGSESHLNRSTWPVLPDAAIAKAEGLVDWRLVRIKGNEVVPMAWTKSFMDVFAPAVPTAPKPRFRILTGTQTRIKKTVAIRTPEERADVDALPPTEPSELYERPVFWAGVAVVGLGAYAAYRAAVK